MKSIKIHEIWEKAGISAISEEAYAPRIVQIPKDKNLIQDEINTGTETNLTQIRNPMWWRNIDAGSVGCNTLVYVIHF